MFALGGLQPQVAQAIQSIPVSQLPSLLSYARTSVCNLVSHRRNIQSSSSCNSENKAESIGHDAITDAMAFTIQELGLDKLARCELDLLNLALQPSDKTMLSPMWTERHTSASTFWENKHGFQEIDLQRASVNLGHILQSRPLVFPKWLPQMGVHAHGFKTRRATKGSLGMGRAKLDPETNFSALKYLRESVMDRVSGKQVKQNERFKNFLSDFQHSPEVQEKLKVAFAEGYAANDKRDSDSGNPWPRRIARVLLLSMVLWLLIQILQGYSAIGGNMKINVLKGERYEVNPEDINVTFDDVKGVDEAKQELKDVVEFLRSPEKFEALGAKLPKGVLLVGPPGIGKTLLARAVAGEAGVPFFHASGSEFDEIFVGTGAKRVRQLFDAAKSRAPCVIFIDEIDTVGAKRTSSQIHPYANQTINQLLSEMDGFQQNDGVIVLGATNRRDNLDKALLRPGRFDVEVRVFAPDLKGRKDILNLYLKKIKSDEDLNIEQLARGTTGCTGADLENIVNQAALKAAMDGASGVSMIHLEFAKDKVLMGPAKKTKIPDEETNLMTAYHEAGHTLVAFYTKDATPVHKVTIVPRGMSLGHTSMIPDKEEYNHSKSQLLAQMDVAMGGRVAEELIYGPDKVTTGASSDFSQATRIATAMVKQFGMSEKVGVRMFDNEAFDSGLSMLKVNDVSPATTELVDSEIKRLLQESYDRAKHILKTHATEHKAVTTALMKYETLDAEEIKDIVDGKKLKAKQRL